MSEADAVDRVAEPATVSTLTEEFRALGVGAGEVVLVHSSLSSLGWVAGDAQAVVEALRNAVTPSGTLVMPTHTTQYSDPAVWSNPPVPDDWVDTIRASRPPFRPAVTPSRGMGAIPECFRTYDDVVRSSHPVYSFAAWGADAEAVVSEHGLDYGLGEDSPLATIAELGGTVLLLGVGHDSNTSLHLAEYRAALERETTRNTVPMLEDGDRVQREYVDIAQSTDDFPEVGAAFEQQGGSAVTTGTVSVATARLLSQPELVDFAVDWFEANR